MERCGAPTRNQTPCQWEKSRCTIKTHRAWHEGVKGAAAQADSPTPRAESAGRPVPGAMRQHDVPGVAWWALEGLAAGALTSSDASVMASLLRVLLAANNIILDDESALGEIELRGLLMHGIPPRTEAEWERLESAFSPEAVAEIRRWLRLLEADGLDGVDPGALGDE